MTDLPTLAQVAAAAGVSSATASRVLTGTVRVSTSTRRQVYDAMSRLGYVRHRAPRGAPARRSVTGIAAVICEHLHRVFAEPYYQRFLSALGDTLGELAVPLVVTAVPPGGPVPTAVLAGSVDGVLLIGAGDALAIMLSTSGLAVRAIGRPPDEVKLPYCDVDNRDGARQAAEHLLLTGHRAIGMISGPPPVAAARDRLEGFAGTLRAVGFTDVPVAYGDFSAPSGTHAMQWLLNRAPGLDAVFAASDLMAVGAIHALRRSGRRVPEDVAVIGYDDGQVARRNNLTTVRQPVEELAALSARLLLSGAVAVNPILPAELIIRESA